MKKSKIAIIVALCAMCLALAMAGCSQNSGQVKMSEGTLVGAWSNMPNTISADEGTEEAASGSTSAASASAESASAESASAQSASAESASAESASAESASAQSASAESASAQSASAEGVASDVASAASASAEGAASGSAESADVEVEEIDANVEPVPLVETFLQVEEDGSAMLLVGGMMYQGTWAISGDTAKLTMEGTPEVTMKFSGVELVLEQNGIQIPLKKSSAEEGLGMGESQVEYVDPEISDFEAVTVADDDKVTIRVTGKGTDYTGDPCFRLSITNKTGEDIYFDTEEEFKVGDKNVFAGVGEVVEPGQTIDEAYLYFDTEELGGGVEALVNVSGQIHLYNIAGEDEVGDEIGSYQVTL